MFAVGFFLLASLVLLGSCAGPSQTTANKPTSWGNLTNCPPAPELAPEPVYSGKAVTLPEVPQLPERPIRIGNAYTVYGAIHHFRSPIHSSEVLQQEIWVEGWISRTNYDEAPTCAVHRVGKEDPLDCRSTTPAFWISDSIENPSYSIKVMGFASNWAQLYTAIMESRRPNPQPVMDDFFGTTMPRPVPDLGAKLRLKASYGQGFTKATVGETDPRNGILTYQQIEYLQEPGRRTVLPGMRDEKPHSPR